MWACLAKAVVAVLEHSAAGQEPCIIANGELASAEGQSGITLGLRNIVLSLQSGCTQL